MVLQTLPDPRQIVQDGDGEFAQMLLRADPGQHQQLRRVYSTPAEDDFARSARRAKPPVSAETHANGSAAFD